MILKIIFTQHWKYETFVWSRTANALSFHSNAAGAGIGSNSFSDHCMIIKHQQQYYIISESRLVTVRMCVHITGTWPCVGRKRKSSRGWRRADIRGLWRLQHLEAILLLCCGQVRCTKLNSTTTIAKRAAETKEGYPCFLTPSLLAEQSPGAPSEQHQATSGEVWPIANSVSPLTHLTYGDGASFVTLTVKLMHAKSP